MASAGLLRIIHGGLQDERLLPPKGQPSTYFEKTFLKAGRFTTEWYRVDFDNRPLFGAQANITLPRRGHLITKAYLVVEMPDIASSQIAAKQYCADNSKVFAGPTFGWTNSIAHALINRLQLTIAGAPISILDGRLMEVLDEFQTPIEKLVTLNRLLGRYPNGFNSEKNQRQTYIAPLPFWFTKDPSAALPIDALGTDQVQINITFNTINNLYNSSQILPSSVSNVGVQAPLAGSPFYFLDAAGSPVFGLDGNPDKSKKVTKIPGVTMPEEFGFGPETYLLLEYVYLDKPEANRLRIGDLSYPITQHYAIQPFNTNGASSARIPLRIPNPTKEIYFYCHRRDADTLNSPFLATRDLSGIFIPDAQGIGPVAPWWPDASGLSTSQFLPLIPAYSNIDSEPITSFALLYEGRIVRYASDAPSYFRSILPSFEKRKTPFHWKYYYNLPFNTQSEFFGVTQHSGEANLDKIPNISLQLEFQPFRGTTRATDVPSYTIYIWAETYNIFRVYGGRGGLLFKY